MGFRFSIKHANWLAHILQPSGATPQLDHDYEARESLKALVEAARNDFYGGRPDRYRFFEALDAAEDLFRGHKIDTRALRPLREYFRDVPWIALLISSAQSECSKMFSSRELLHELVDIRPDDPGLILQLSEPPDEEGYINLENVFPAIKVALSNATRWPGVLLWTPMGDAVFFEVPDSTHAARESLHWLFSHLAVGFGSPNLLLLRTQHERQMGKSTKDILPLRILHLSDPHLGSRIAQRRLPRVKQLIQQFVDDLGEQAPVVPVLTGDIMDTPGDTYLDAARDFIEFLYGVGSEDPVVVLGNHDVRKDGWISQDLQSALRIQTEKVRWFDRSKVGLACFNSACQGKLARGFIDERELMEIGQHLDHDRNKADTYLLAGILHHHPIPVDKPDWHRRRWYEGLFGNVFQKTVELENAKQFLQWLSDRKFETVLHGHEHIPRADVHENLLVVGCGSTTGKVETVEKGTTFMSINVVTIDTAKKRISCRLRGERIPGGGMVSDEQHEFVLTKSI